MICIAWKKFLFFSWQQKVAVIQNPKWPPIHLLIPIYTFYNLQGNTRGKTPLTIYCGRNMRMAGWQRFQIARNCQWPSPKSFDSDKNCQPKHMLFRHIFKISCDFRTFSGVLWGKKCFLGSKIVFLARSAL